MTHSTIYPQPNSFNIANSHYKAEPKTKMQEGKIAIDDCGIFIGLSSMPLPFSKGKAFYEKKIRSGIFDRYRRTVLEYAFSKDQDEASYVEAFEKYFYQTRAYYLFGSYELAVLALVDDFKLGNKTFHPYSYLSEGLLAEEELPGAEPETFSFHTMTGISAVGNTEDVPYISSALINRAKDTFLKPEEAPGKFPFIGICSLKINNALLIGQRDVVEYLIAKKVEYVLATTPGAAEDFDFILLRTTAWNEYTLLLFTDSYDLMTALILSIRELQCKDLHALGQGDRPMIEEMKDQCLLSSLIKKWQEGDHHLVDEAHLFVHSHTTFGFDLSLFDFLSEEGVEYPADFLPIKDEAFQLNIRFDVKPGHLKTLLGKLKSDPGSAKISIGSGDFIYPSQSGDISMVYRDLLKQERINQLSKHIRKIYASPDLNLDLSKIKGSKLEEHFFYTHRLNQFAFRYEEIKTLREQLIRCRVAKGVREKVINMYVNFNHQVQDPVLFNYFIELKPFLRDVMAGLQHFSEAQDTSVEDITNQLWEWTLFFEKAFNNRFNLSYQSHNQPALHLDFNVGVQQLVSLFDGVAKILASCIDLPFQEGPSLVISSTSELNFSGSVLEVGLHHLIQPSLFLSMATQMITSDFLLRTAGLSGTYEEFQHQTVRLLGQQEELPFLATEHELDAFLGTLFNYYVTYNKDSELFLFWYWHQFLQQPGAYHQNGEIEESLFVRYLLRMMVLMEFVDHEGEYFQSKLMAPFPELQNLWFRWFIHIRKRVDEILDNKPVQILKSWFDQAKTLVLHEVIPKLYTGALERGWEEEADLIAAYRQIRENRGQPLSPANASSIKEQMAQDWHTDLDTITGLVLSQLEQGRVFKPPVSQYRSASFYLQALSLAYLRLIRSSFKEEHTMLYRLPANGAPSAFFDPIDTRFERKYGPFAFDPKGGLFTTSIAARRKYFRYRVALYMSLTAIVAKQKLKLYE